MVSCSGEKESENIGQSLDNFKHFLLKDFNCDCEGATKLIDEAVAAVIISVICNFKVVYKIVSRFRHR